MQNPHLGPKLRQLGLTPETAFGCATEFLFPPVPEIFEGVAAEKRVLMEDSSTLRIGIQVCDAERARRLCSSLGHFNPVKDARTVTVDRLMIGTGQVDTCEKCGA